jgi:hypothetical protein
MTLTLLLLPLKLFDTKIAFSSPHRLSVVFSS